ncbi:MAG: response regulator transcription factor [Aquiluna sp.]|nr:response regulator transcription factor [Aquiluna sp.]MCF8545576.1 response regulator transcription factor [Aquiluna sp.]
MANDARGDVALGRRSPLAKSRVVVADNTVISRVGIRTILERTAGTAVVAEASTYDATLLAVEEHAPDVLVIDLDLGDDTTKGLQLCETISNKYSDTKILVLVKTVSEFVVVDALRRGALGFFLKEQVSADELQRAVRAVQKGETVLGQGVSKLIAKSLGSSKSDSLSDRELDVIRLLGRGLGNKEIAKELFISESTVKFHVHNICKKFGCTKRTQVVHHATAAGLLAN